MRGPGVLKPESLPATATLPQGSQDIEVQGARPSSDSNVIVSQVTVRFSAEFFWTMGKVCLSLPPTLHGNLSLLYFPPLIVKKQSLS